MREYISTSEAAKKWGLIRRRVMVLCAEGRIPGAQFVGDRWMVPVDVEKPADARIKSGKYIKAKKADLIYKPTTSSAIEFGVAGRLEEWIHLFLCGEGGNKAFSDGLKLEPRYYYLPEMMELDKLKRCCGPETNMEFQTPEDAFNNHVNNIAEKYKESDWDMPPLIIYRDCNGYVLNDGNHRYEALKRLGIKEYWVIIWEPMKR